MSKYYARNNTVSRFNGVDVNATYLELYDDEEVLKEDIDRAVEFAFPFIKNHIKEDKALRRIDYQRVKSATSDQVTGSESVEDWEDVTFYILHKNATETYYRQIIDKEISLDTIFDLRNRGLIDVDIYTVAYYYEHNCLLVYKKIGPSLESADVLAEGPLEAGPWTSPRRLI